MRRPTKPGLNLLLKMKATYDYEGGYLVKIYHEGTHATTYHFLSRDKKIEPVGIPHEVIIDNSEEVHPSTAHSLISNHYVNIYPVTRNQAVEVYHISANGRDALIENHMIEGE